MIPEEGEILSCEYCRKKITATQDMNYWFCLSEVKGGEESIPNYFCCRQCLKSWINESEFFSLVRLVQQEEDEIWREEDKHL